MAVLSVQRRLWRWAPGAFVFGFALSLALFGGSGYAAPGNVHTSVYSWAAQHPGEQVPVIVQTTGDTSEAVAAVEANGGEVKRDFSFISAVEATVPVSSLAEVGAQLDSSYISLDAPMQSAGFVDVSNLATAYPFAVNAPAVWNAATPRTGAGVGVAVIDSGVSWSGNSDFLNADGTSRVTDVIISSTTTNANDGYGHGTHVSGIVGGNGNRLNGKYIGIAPKASILNVKIADDMGATSLGDAIAGVQWAVDNKDLYNIRVMNLSLQSSVAQSYKTDPLDAAVEYAWVRGIVVVVAAGNAGTASDAVSYAPANDPFVVAVGATDDAGTPTLADDTVAPFSSRGVTQDGFVKPDVVAPGRRIVSDINPSSVLAVTEPDRFVDGVYFRLSGTSMSTPLVSGIVALMLEQNPQLRPGQVKYILLQTSQLLPLDSTAKEALADAATFYTGTPLDADARLTPGRQIRMNFTAKLGAIAFVYGSADPVATAAAVGLDMSRVAPAGTTLAAIQWNAIQWNAIQWNAIQWNAIQWSAIQWSAIQWGSTAWDSVKWNAIKFGSVKWDAIQWNAIQWSAIQWSALQWDAVTTSDATLTTVAFKSSNFDSSSFDSSKFNSAKFDVAKTD